LGAVLLRKNMDKRLEAACAALDDLAKTILNMWTEERIYTEALGWMGPAINRHELASIASNLSDDIRSVAVESVSESIENFLNDIPRRIQVLEANTLPQMINGNGGQAIPAYLTTLQFFRARLLPEIGLVIAVDEKSLPTKLLRRIRSANSQLEEATASLEGLDKKVSEILSAHSAALSLPADLQDLKEAKNDVANAVGKSLGGQSAVEGYKASAFDNLEIIKEFRSEAEKLVQNCEEAYRITTSKGLAGAFQERADKLALSMWVWVAGLVVSLFCAYTVGGKAIELFMKLFEDDQHKGMGLQAALTALGVFAPLWFAWVSTKQIGERFRLSEDYAFKASVSKAYEGYRREAASLDEKFAARLFSSALTRLDEAPLRLVEKENHGSPWHGLVKGIFSPRIKTSTPNSGETKEQG
jgi:hypothetical protein